MPRLLKNVFFAYLRSGLSTRPFAVRMWKGLYQLSIKALGITNYDVEGNMTGENWMVRFVTGRFRINTMVDVGANVGNYSKFFFAQAPQVRIVGFEPHPANYQKLLANTSGITGAEFYSYGVGNPLTTGTTLSLYDYGDEGSEHAAFSPDVFVSVYQKNVSDLKKIEVPVISIDQFFANKLDHIDFLKIDTEGFEMEVLKGARNFLSEGRISFIHFEFGYTQVGRSSFFDFWQLLHRQYRLYRLMPRGFLPIEEYTQDCEIYQYQNLLAVQRSFNL